MRRVVPGGPIVRQLTGRLAGALPSPQSEYRTAHQEHCALGRGCVMESRQLSASLKFNFVKRWRQQGAVALASVLAAVAAAQTPLPASPELSPLTTTRQVLDLGLEVTRQLPHPVCVVS